MTWLEAATAAKKGGHEEWLCPALFKYFEEAAKTVYVKAELLQRVP